MGEWCSRHPGLTLWFAIFFLMIIVMILFPENSPPRATSRVNPEDQRAYDALRARGESDQDAAAAAKAVRELCEASGGTDCQ